MRLVCPNCSAQYEIDGSMIPEEGRDVQCSNCGHTWFELPAPAASLASGSETEPDHEVEDEFDSPPAYDLDDDDSFEDEDDVIPSSRQQSVPDFISREDFEDDSVRETSVFSDWDEEADEKPSEPEQPEEGASEDDTSAVIRAVTAAADAEPAPESTDSVEAVPSEDEPADEPTRDEDDENEDTTLTSVASAAAATPRRPADAAALDILREEAERELSQRRAAPSEPLETQSDLGLEDIRNRRTPSRALRARMAHLGEDLPEEEPKVEVSEPAPAPRPSPPEDDGYEEPRRDLLPDIDEINSTLKSSRRGAEAEEAVQRSGFRYGFLLVLFLTAAAIFAYAQAPAIARALPQTESTMISYVDWANGLRDWVDGLISN